MKRAFIFLLLLIPLQSFARDNGQYAQAPLKEWFNSLASKKGNCCSAADGRTLSDPDWGTDGNGYWVIVDGQKLTVPPEALLTVPNRFGQAVVWPYKDEKGELQIRCFLPGAGT